jgi:hypothetical protein
MLHVESVMKELLQKCIQYTVLSVTDDGVRYSRRYNTLQAIRYN